MCFFAVLSSLGHNLAEMVSVQAYLHSKTEPLTWVGGALLEYVQDDAQVGKVHKYDLIHYTHICASMVNIFCLLTESSFIFYCHLTMIK